MKNLLDKLAKKYDTIDFIDADPVRYLHKFNNIKDIEITGFISSIFAYGKRELFLKKLDYFFDNYNEFKKGNFGKFENFDYRFSKGVDFICILEILTELYEKGESLGSLFKYGYEKQKTIPGMMQCAVDYFYARANKNVTRGFYHLLPDPSKGGAMKRMNMMLRQFVRKSPVDVGIWKFIDKSELIIPLDVHVASVSRKLGLLTRKNNDFKSAVEITRNLKKFDPKDPVKYDFALFGAGIEKVFDNNNILQKINKNF